MKMYKGVRSTDGKPVVTSQQGDGKARELRPLQDLPYKVQDFEWGPPPRDSLMYNARDEEHRRKCIHLAYAILENVLGKDRARKDFGLYAVNAIAGLPFTAWTITEEDVIAAALQMSLQQQEWKDRRKG